MTGQGAARKRAVVRKPGITVDFASQDEAELIRDAAHYIKTSRSAFMRTVSLREARKVVLKHQTALKAQLQREQESAPAV